MSARRTNPEFDTALATTRTTHTRERGEKLSRAICPGKAAHSNLGKRVDEREPAALRLETARERARPGEPTLKHNQLPVNAYDYLN